MDDFDNVAPAVPRVAGQLFMPRTQRQALAELVRAIVAGEPFVALTGKPGVGKTTVLDTAVAVIAERGLRIRRIDNPHGTPLRLPQIIGELLGNAPGTMTNEDIERLFDALTMNNEGSQVVLVFDDAHYLQADVLGYLQIVSSLHALGIRNQRVIFAGRPEFWDLLEDPKLRDLVGRTKARPVIEPLGEAEARDFLCYQLEQMYGAIRQQVSDAALSRLVQYGEGIPGRLDPILLKSLVAAGGYRQLGPEAVDAGAYTFARGALAVVVPAATENHSRQMVASYSPPATIPERRHRVLHPGALVCLAVLLVGSIGTAWRSSVQPDPREMSGPATTASTTLPEPPTQTAIVLAADAASPPDASEPPAPATPAVTSSSLGDTPVVAVPPPPTSESQQQPAAASAADTSAPVAAANQEALAVAGSSFADARTNSSQDAGSPPGRIGDAATALDATSTAHGSWRSADADAQPAQPQNSPVTPATPSIATTAVAPQPAPAAAAPQLAPASPPATNADAQPVRPQNSPVTAATSAAVVPSIAATAVVPRPRPAAAAPQLASASPPATDADAQPVRPQNSLVTAATSAAVIPSIAATAVVPQPPPAAAAPQPASTSPLATDAAVPSMQPSAASLAPPASAAATVATQTTEPIDRQAKPPNTSPPSATTASATASSPSTDATPWSGKPDHTPAAPAANPGVPISAATGPTVLATQRTIVPGLVAASPSAQTDLPKTAAPPPVVSVTPARLETSAPAAAGTIALPTTSSSPHLAPTETKAAPQPASLPPDIVADLLRRGDAMLVIGDVASARLLYRRAAESGEARAATQLAKTYDPLFLTKIGAWGMPTDAATAAKWYRRAAALGDAEAAERLKNLAEAVQ